MSAGTFMMVATRLFETTATNSLTALHCTAVNKTMHRIRDICITANGYQTARIYSPIKRKLFATNYSSFEKKSGLNNCRHSYKQLCNIPHERKIHDKNCNGAAQHYECTRSVLYVVPLMPVRKIVRLSHLL
jgi:hypothetical protein